MLIGMGLDAVRVKGMDRVWMGGNGGCLGVDKIGIEGRDGVWDWFGWDWGVF